MATAAENLGWLGFYLNSTNGTLGGTIGISNNADGQTLTRTGNIPGVTDVFQGHANPIGDGTLTFTEAANVVGGDGSYHEFSWAAFGETAGNVFAYVDGDEGPFTLESSGGGQVTIQVNDVSLPTVNDTETVTVANNLGGIFPNVTKTIAANGETQYRCIYLRNRCPIGQADRDFADIRIYMEEDTAAADTIELGFEKNQTTATIVDEFTAPAGITFGSYIGFANAYQTSLEKSLANSDTLAVWIKRTIPPQASIGSPLNQIKLRYMVLD